MKKVRSSQAVILILNLVKQKCLPAKLHAFTVNGSEKVYDGVCFWHHAMIKSVFSKASGFSYKW